MDERIKNNPPNSETQNGSTKGLCESCNNRYLCYSFCQQQEWSTFHIPEHFGHCYSCENYDPDHCDICSNGSDYEKLRECEHAGCVNRDTSLCEHCSDGDYYQEESHERSFNSSDPEPVKKLDEPIKLPPDFVIDPVTARKAHMNCVGLPFPYRSMSPVMPPHVPTMAMSYSYPDDGSNMSHKNILTSEEIEQIQSSKPSSNSYRRQRIYALMQKATGLDALRCICTHNTNRGLSVTYAQIPGISCKVCGDKWNGHVIEPKKLKASVEYLIAAVNEIKSCIYAADDNPERSIYEDYFTHLIPALKGLPELYSLVREALDEEIASAKPQFMPPLNPMVPADYGMIPPKPVANNPSVSPIRDNNSKEEK